jgi:hypothetical protein
MPCTTTTATRSATLIPAHCSVAIHEAQRLTTSVCRE